LDRLGAAGFADADCWYTENRFALGVRGPRIWDNNLDFSNVPLLGKLPYRALGDSLKVPSDVDMQCFFRLGRYHFNASDRSISPITPAAIPLVPFRRVPPPKESVKGLFRESPLVGKHSDSSELCHSSWVTAGEIVVVRWPPDGRLCQTFVGPLPPSDPPKKRKEWLSSSASITLSR
jgi:hypothetical protein